MLATAAKTETKVVFSNSAFSVFCHQGAQLIQQCAHVFPDFLLPLMHLKFFLLSLPLIARFTSKRALAFAVASIHTVTSVPIFLGSGQSPFLHSVNFFHLSFGAVCFGVSFFPPEAP